MVDDNIQHGIDDNTANDPEKGAALGGLGGAVVGATAGSAVGPVGTVVGAVVGGLTGAGVSGAAVAAVHQVDNENTITGLGSGVTPDVANTSHNVAHNTAAAVDNTVSNVNAELPGNSVPGVQTGGHAVDGTPDTRGITEKAADAVTGDHIDDKTGKVV